MHAIRQHEHGGPDVLRWEAVPSPVPGPGQARVAVELAGVHLLDASMRAGGHTGTLPPPTLPMTPGREVAGVVDAVGEGVDPGWIGRRVVAHLGMAHGGYAERALAPAAQLHAVPGDVPLRTAVAMIGTGRTALLVLRQAAVGPDDVVLVPAAAGGLGALLVQGALRAGATVVGLAGGPAKAERVRALGATAVDYLAPDWDEAARAALGDRRGTLLLDGVGGDVGRRLARLVGWGGRVLAFGWSGGEQEPGPDRTFPAARGLTHAWALGPLDAADLRDLESRALAAAAARELVPLVDGRFRLADAAAAHAALEGRGTTGKVVLRAA